MRTQLEARLVELLRADDEDVFQQGLEMLRCGGWGPHDRFLLARLLCDRPHRSLAVMTDASEERRALERRYAAGCLRRLADREAQAARLPSPTFTRILPVLGQHAATEARDEAVLMCRAEVSRLRARGRQHTMSSTDPSRYSAVRLLEVLADLLEGAGDTHAHMRALVRQLSTLEPRGLVGYEERDRREMCRAALEEALQSRL